MTGGDLLAAKAPCARGTRRGGGGDTGHAAGAAGRGLPCRCGLARLLPMNEMSGVDAIAARVWLPLLHAFPDLERRDTLLMGGHGMAATGSVRLAIIAARSGMTG